MTLSRNAKRRIALYGSAALVVAAATLTPILIRRRTPPIRIRTFDLAADATNEATRMLIDYLRIDTTNPPGGTRAAVAFLAERLACEGIAYEVVGSDPDRPILVARVRGSSREGALLLLHHMDVVPAGDLKAWTEPPFAGRIGTATASAGYVYGRGVIDMKSYGISHFFALAALVRAGITPKRDVVFLAEPGEESFQPEIGVGWVLKNRPDLVAGVTDVFNEGGVNEVITDHVDRFGIEVLQKGVARFAFRGSDRAVLEAFKSSLKEIDKTLPLRLDPTMAEFLEFIGPSRGDIWGRSLIEPAKALTAKNFRDYAPEVYRWYLKDVILAGPVKEEGSGFRVDVAWLTLPGDSVDAGFRRLTEEAGSRGLTWHVDLKTDDAAATPRTGRAWRAIETVFSLDAERAPVGVYVLPAAYTNSAYLRARGFRAFGVSPFTINFNDSSRIHGVNERIHVGFFVEGVERMKNIVMDFATSD